jgi:carboxypeptidase Taq
MEMQICRSYEFLKFTSPFIKRIFNKKGKMWEAKNLYKIYTFVKPSFIRVDADEVTYPLHVIIRYKIEKELIEGNIKVKEIPGIWNMYMKKYLGIYPKNNKEGCLQDIHWFDGTFGYFPTYTLGALYAAQLFAEIRKKIPNLSNQVSKGNFDNLIKWLRHNIHAKGSLCNSEELIKNITGEELNIEYFKKHLINRYLN